VQRVAAAWSRKDLPPQKLDAMFRCVEAVYRANRSFGVVSLVVVHQGAFYRELTLVAEVEGDCRQSVGRQGAWGPVDAMGMSTTTNVRS
jgi:hypothetical protein